jgi:hypothetical protein
MTLILVSQNAFDEIRRKVDEIFGFLVTADGELDMEGIVLKAQEEKPSALRLALKEGLKKDGTSTSE